MYKAIAITGKSTPKKVKDTLEALKKDNVIVMIHADWCVHCQMMKPYWKALKSYLKKNKINVTVIEIESQGLGPMVAANKGLDVMGFPTIKYKTSKGRKLNEYNGPRDIDGLKKNLIKKFA